jgi:hypothetical protein
MTKKILIYSTPFSGHLNVLKDLISEYGDQYQFHLVITGWNNIVPDIKDVNVSVSSLAKSELQETDPALWTLPRIAELFNDCLKIAEVFQPDIIIYDFFSLEGNLVGKKLSIPYWSSISALMGPFNTQEYLKEKLGNPLNQAALHDLSAQDIPFDVKELEMISDGLHLPGEKNLVWSYPSLTPNNIMEGRKEKPYIFIGNLRGSKYQKRVTGKKPVVYMSLGTVVMDNMWNQQPETRSRLIELISHLAELWEDREFDIIFPTFGKRVLESYPNNWHIFEKVNQVEVLSKASVFVTHAGGNSFHEAILQRVPMVAIPFFGDQPLVAQQIEKLGIGINLVKDRNIDTHKNKEFLGKDLAERIDMAVGDILTELDKYQVRFEQIPLNATSFQEVVEEL